MTRARYRVPLLRRPRKPAVLALVVLQDLSRPVLRSQCVNGPRPCPWWGCRFHLGIDTNGAQGITRTPLGADSCALDVAERGALPVADVAPLVGLSRIRTRQVEATALAKLAAALAAPPGAGARVAEQETPRRRPEPAESAPECNDLRELEDLLPGRGWHGVPTEPWE